MSLKAIKGLLLGLVFFLMSGCVGKSIHSDLKENTQLLTRRWVRSTHGLFDMGDHGTEYSNPVVSDDRLVFGNRSVGLISIYPKINEERWRLPIQGGVVSELTIDQDYVYFGGGDGFLYCVRLENGKVVWKYDLHNPVISRPTLYKGRALVTTSDDTVYALDANTGKWLWHYKRRTAPLTTIYGASSPLVDKNEVLTGLSDGYLIALSLDDGQLKWEKKLHDGIKFTNINAHPVLENELLYVPAYDGSLYILKRDRGEMLWKFDAGGSKDVVIDKDRLYLPSSNGTIYALKKSNAKQLWSFTLDRGTPTQLIVVDRYIIVGSSFQYLYVIDKMTGTGLYRFNVGNGSGFSGSPSWDPQNQMLYILSESGNLYAFAWNH